LTLFASKLTVCLRIRRHWLSVRAIPHWGNPIQIEGMARVALRPKERGGSAVVAIGQEAAPISASEDIVVYDAFCHPRVLIGGFDAALIVVREFIRQTCGTRKPWQKFRLVIQTQDDLEGGLTDIEERALQELGLRLGAGTIVIHQSMAELTDTDLLRMR
jgi:hypothetical protein